jgi:hypothetical protein
MLGQIPLLPTARQAPEQLGVFPALSAHCFDHAAQQHDGIAAQTSLTHWAGSAAPILGQPSVFSGFPSGVARQGGPQPGKLQQVPLFCPLVLPHTREQHSELLVHVSGLRVQHLPLSQPSLQQVSLLVHVVPFGSQHFLALLHCKSSQQLCASQPFPAVAHAAFSHLPLLQKLLAALARAQAAGAIGEAHAYVVGAVLGTAVACVRALAVRVDALGDALLGGLVALAAAALAVRSARAALVHA